MSTYVAPPPRARSLHVLLHTSLLPIQSFMDESQGPVSNLQEQMKALTISDHAAPILPDVLSTMASLALVRT